MKLSISTIEKCNAELKKAIEAYDLFNLPNGMRCERQLLKLCVQELNKPVTIVVITDSKNDKVKTIKGSYLALVDSYQICLVENLNPCWKRFVICKELFHVLFDNPEFENMELSSHIEDCVSETPAVEDTPEAAQSEFLAEYSAMEFLFPYVDRLAIINKGEPIDYMAVAKHYRVPRIYVERYLTEHMLKLASILIKIN